MQTHVYTRSCTYKTTETSIKDMQSAPQLQFTDKLTGGKINDDDNGGDDSGDDDDDARKDDAMNSSDDELLYNAAQAYEEESARRPPPQTDGDVIASDDDVDGTEQEQTTQPTPTGWYTAFTLKFFQHLYGKTSFGSPVRLSQ